MNIFEAGILSGAPMGAVIGGIVCKEHGILGILGGSLAGIVSGAAAGWLYGVVVIGLLGVIGGVWRGVRKRPDPSEADMRVMSHRAIRDVFMSAVISFIVWVAFGWLYALLAALAFALVSTFATVAQ